MGEICMNIKKLKILLTALAIMVTMSACTSGASSEAFQQGFKAMESGDYEVAQKYFSEAVEKGYDKNDIDELYEIVLNYNEASACIENDDYEGARKYVELVPPLYRTYKIKTEVEYIKEIIKEYDENAAVYEEAYDLYKSEAYDEARKIAETIDTKYLDDDQKQNIDSMLKITVKEDEENDFPVPDTEIELLMDNYSGGLAEAINTGDFSKVSHTLYPGSSLYQAQQRYVEESYNEEIKQRAVLINVVGIKWTSDTTCTINTDETAYVTDTSGESKIKTYSSKYTAKLYNGSLRLTSMTKN